MQIRLENMEFYAFHGVYEQEQRIGNRFLVDLTVEADLLKAGLSDQIDDTLNYEQLYRIVQQQMEQTSALLEHVAVRMVHTIQAQFPQIQHITARITKCNPPLGGQIERVSVEYAL
ncbi:MAG: dihydroneopterin aldolase [Prevotellaceae bacterium]|jgi:dihydroneopterin aldolase|nr:dihydroneopterin aldolase [Prevotellaceae bacterium]